MQSRERRWDELHAQLRAFMMDKGRMPRLRSAEPPEARLALWADNQRRRASSERRIDLLNDLPLWEWTPGDAAWASQTDRLMRHLATFNALPRLRADQQAERSVARWLNRQRHLLRSGRLPHPRAVALRDLLENAASELNTDGQNAVHDMLRLLPTPPTRDTPNNREASGP